MNVVGVVILFLFIATVTALALGLCDAASTTDDIVENMRNDE